MATVLKNSLRTRPTRVRQRGAKVVQTSTCRIPTNGDATKHAGLFPHFLATFFFLAPEDRRGGGLLRIKPIYCIAASASCVRHDRSRQQTAEERRKWKQRRCRGRYSRAHARTHAHSLQTPAQQWNKYRLSGRLVKPLFSSTVASRLRGGSSWWCLRVMLRWLTRSCAASGASVRFPDRGVSFRGSLVLLFGNCPPRFRGFYAPSFPPSFPPLNYIDVRVSLRHGVHAHAGR